jgi:hypothetical protein
MNGHASDLALDIWQRHVVSPGVIPFRFAGERAGRLDAFRTGGPPLWAEIYRRWMPADAGPSAAWTALPFAMLARLQRMPAWDRGTVAPDGRLVRYMPVVAVRIMGTGEKHSTWATESDAEARPRDATRLASVSASGGVFVAPSEYNHAAGGPGAIIRPQAAPVIRSADSARGSADHDGPEGPTISPEVAPGAPAGLENTAAATAGPVQAAGTEKPQADVDRGLAQGMPLSGTPGAPARPPVSVQHPTRKDVSMPSVAMTRAQGQPLLSDTPGVPTALGRVIHRKTETGSDEPWSGVTHGQAPALPLPGEPDTPSSRPTHGERGAFTSLPLFENPGTSASPPLTIHPKTETSPTEPPAGSAHVLAQGLPLPGQPVNPAHRSGTPAEAVGYAGESVGDNQPPILIEARREVSSAPMPHSSPTGTAGTVATRPATIPARMPSGTGTTTVQVEAPAPGNQGSRITGPATIGRPIVQRQLARSGSPAEIARPSPRMGPTPVGTDVIGEVAPPHSAVTRPLFPAGPEPRGTAPRDPQTRACSAVPTLMSSGVRGPVVQASRRPVGEQTGSEAPLLRPGRTERPATGTVRTLARPVANGLLRGGDVSILRWPAENPAASPALPESRHHAGLQLARASESAAAPEPPGEAPAPAGLPETRPAESMPDAEVDRIADRVYGLLVRRLAAERERRGL